jgi:soluble lytic murein transglycosylase-like protein
MRPWRAVPFLLLASVQARAIEPLIVPMRMVSGYRYQTVISDNDRRQLLAAVRWLNSTANDGDPNARERKNRGHRFEKAVSRAATVHGIDRSVLEALLMAESRFRPNAVSHKGAMGLGQLMPQTAVELGVSNPFSPEENIDASAYYLSKMLERFGSLKLALAAYNAGPGAVKKHNGIPPYKETQAFVEKIMGQISEPPEKDFFVVSK